MVDNGARSTSPLARSGGAIARGAVYFGMSRRELMIAASFFVFLIAFKIANIICSRFDTDEPQHLHVIWGWARGFVQYRDIFDNHMPLFQIMFAPIFGLIGDRASLLIWMRFILLPMYLVAAWCTYRIGAQLFSRRVGVWAVILTGFYPGYHFCSSEFRTDNVWAPLWLLCIVVLLNGALTMRRASAAGVLLGLCFGISMKTTLLLLSIFVGALAALLLVDRKRLDVSWAHLARSVATLLASAAVIPAAIMLAFAFAGIWPQFRYSVFDYNFLPGERNHPAWWIMIFPVAFPLALYAARLIIRRAPDCTAAFRRGFVFLICGFYLPALLSFWGLVSRQDYLPFHPLVFVFCSAGLLAIVPRGNWVAVGAAVEFFVALASHPFWMDKAKLETHELRAILKLTNPGDFVFDRKGETIFRQRCFRPVLESIAVERLRRGLMKVDVGKRCVETRTCVAATLVRMPETVTRFINENYLPIGNDLRVAGAILRESAKDRQHFEFETVIPAAYEIIAPNGARARGMLDGAPYDGRARFLSPGKHNFAAASELHSLTALWAQAVDRGFRPVQL